MKPQWPDRWQPEAIAAVEPYVGTDVQIEILRDDPHTTIYGMLYGGFVYVDDDGRLTIIHDKSGNPYVFPGRCQMGRS